MHKPAVVAALLASVSIWVVPASAQDVPADETPPQEQPAQEPVPEEVPPPAPDAAAPAEPADENLLAYRTFREHFDARRFAEALPAAQRVLELSENKFGPEQMELVTPLTNLATTQLRLKDYPAAEVTFLRAVKIVELRTGGFAREIIRPVFGLGVTYAAAGQHQDAVTQLRRAIDVSRRIDGLFNPAQIELVEPLIQSYLALDQLADMEREQQYLVRLAESAYGKDDPRILPTLERSASLYEEAGRYFSARLLHSRAVGLIYKANKKQAEENKQNKDKKDRYDDLRMVEPLRGIARTYRLEYVYGLEKRDEEAEPKNPTMTVGGSTTPSTDKIEDSGRWALEQALRILQEDPAATVKQRAETRVDLGDWYLAAGDKRNAFETYKAAWTELAAGGPGTALFDEPVQLAYRGPTGALRRPPVPIEEFDEHYVEVQFTVNKDGQVKDAKVTDSDATESQKKAVMNAIGRARYRPKFVEGEPVETGNVRFRQALYTKKKSG